MTDSQPTTCTCAVPCATAHACNEVPKVTYLSNDDVTRLFVSQHPGEVVAHRDVLAAQIQRLSDFLDARSLNSWKHGACWAAEDAINTLLAERDEARVALDRVKAQADALDALADQSLTDPTDLRLSARSIRAAIEGP